MKSTTGNFSNPCESNIEKKTKQVSSQDSSQVSSQDSSDQTNRDTFSRPNDVLIKNKYTVLGEINKALGRNKPPSVEFVTAKPHAAFNFLGIGYGINFNWYSHSAVIYTMPNGERKVFNVLKVAGQPNIVEFMSPEQYFFERNSDQGGIWNRSFVSIRIEDVSDEAIIKMDKKFKAIQENSINGSAKFEVILGPIYNKLRNYFPKIAERGNCARWASVGLEEAGLVTKRSLFPKDTFIRLFEELDPENTNVVSYKCIVNAEKDYGAKAVNPLQPVSPLQFLRNMFYWDLDKFSKVTVRVPEGHDHAVVELNDPKRVRKQSKLRNAIVNNSFVMFGCALTSLYLLKKYPGAALFRTIGSFRSSKSRI
jgi:hypothetical protein